MKKYRIVNENQVELAYKYIRDPTIEGLPILAFSGAPGCGKTTLMSLIANKVCLFLWFFILHVLMVWNYSVL